MSCRPVCRSTASFFGVASRLPAASVRRIWWWAQGTDASDVTAGFARDLATADYGNYSDTTPEQKECIAVNGCALNAEPSKRLLTVSCAR